MAFWAGGFLERGLGGDSLGRCAILYTMVPSSLFVVELFMRLQSGNHLASSSGFL
jgi:hypothetical protein